MKEYLNSAEAAVAGWYKNLPQPPRIFSRWLYDNIWWLVVASVVLGVFGILATIKDLSMEGYHFPLSMYGIFSTMDQAAVTVSIVVSIVVILINLSAIKPLRSKYKIGWNLLFVSLILSALSVGASVVLTFDVGSFISGAIFTVATGYLLFSFRDQYVVHSIKSTTKKKSAKN